MATCQLCKKDKPLCNAHLTPDSFGRWIKEDNFFLAICDDTKKKQQTIEFDKNILCADCDNKLGIFDKYFFEFCKKAYDNPQRKKPFNSAGTFKDISTIIETKTMNIQLGVVATLWRHSISRRSSIDLGNKYNNIFREWLEYRMIPNEEKHFCNVLPILCMEHEIDKYILQPFGVKNNTCHIYFFQIPGMYFIIEVGHICNFTIGKPILLNETEKATIVCLPDEKKFLIEAVNLYKEKRSMR